MGAALTVPFTDRGHTVALWCTEHDERIRRALSAGNPHPKLNTRLPDTLQILPPEELEDALRGTGLIVLGVSTPGVLPVLGRAQSVMSDLPPLVTVAKGFIEIGEYPYPVPSAVRHELGNLMPDNIPALFSLAGPSIAGELVRRRPSAAALSGSAPDELNPLSQNLTTDYFWIDPVEDFQSLEICLAYKNIYAIALAWPGGLGGGRETFNSRQNLSAILMIQVLKELNRLVAACGGDPVAVGGWAGLGDLIATSGGGRNGRFGELLASGHSSAEALDQLKKEGVKTIEGHLSLPYGIRYARKVLGNNWSDQLPLLAGIQRTIEGSDSVPEFIEGLSRFRETQPRGSPRK